MVIPNFVRQALAGQPITVYGDGTQIALLQLRRRRRQALLAVVAEPRGVGEVFNIGNTEEISIGELAEKVKDLTGARPRSS